ncbi:MAG: DNRLRE domain-containing protein [Chloroflexi bacterium]|nr:DNRLRE domain-containing protein [Chloroflexota bacterium]
MNFRVQFSEAVTGVDSSDFTLPLTGVPVAGTYITGVTPDPLDASLYTVQVNTGTGDGIIKLDVKNSATGIFDINENLPLNGGFTTGESYTIDKTAPTVISFSLASPNPTNAAEVNFIFTFDEIVTGVDPNDFELLASGVSGASISSVTVLNSKSHIISVNTGSGNGIISLVLRPSPASSIADLASNLLNVPIPGYFTSPYTIDKVAPTTSSSSLASANPTSSSNVEFTVTFPEPVSGVDVNDFALTTTGVFGAAISGINGSGSVYTISVDTGNGNGTIRLDISVDASISDLTGNQLTGLPYTNGETYTVTKTTDAPWNTFLGGDGNDRSYAMIGDGLGNFYVSGISSSGWGNPIQPYSGGDDVFLAKVDASGNLVWHTFIGGLFPENYGQELALDDNGDVYVAGRGDSSWGNPVRPYSDLGDGFVTKINTSGQVLWTTFLGGATSFDAAKGIEVKNGSVFVTGHSSASWGSPFNEWTGGIDGFLVSLDAGTGNLNWNTFLGGTGEDYLFTVHVDNSENIFLAGYSTETWGTPVIAHTPGTNNDGFAAKFNAAGVLMWNTFMGSSEGSDMVYGMDESAAGDIYLAGRSPASWGDPLNIHAGGGIDAFIAKMDPATGVLAWHRFVGGSGSDFSWGIDVDENDNIHIVGGSDASWGSPVRAHAGGYEAFYARLNASGELLGNSFAGGGGADRGYGLVLGASNDIYLSGYSDATWDTPIRAYTNGNDAFLVRLDMTGMPVVVSSVTRASENPTNASSVNFKVTFSEAVTGVDAGDFALSTSGVTGASVTGVSGAGNTYTVTVNTGSGSGSIRLDVVDDDSITNASSAPLSGGFSTGQAFLVDNLAPTVLSSMRGPINPDTSGLNFTVTFSEPVTGVDVTDFGLTTTGVTGAGVSSVTGAGNTYTVNVNAGSGSGTVRLNIVDDDTILDAVSNQLGGAGAGNGNYIAGETYSVTSVTLNSIGTQDGHILESSENSGVGGTVNSTATSFYVGDNNADRQYLSVMHFDTSALPDTAVIASATLRVRQQGSFTGTNPFTTHGNLVAAVQNPYFGASNSLLAEDFQAASGLAGIATFSSTPVSSWFSAPLNPEGFLYVNLAGATQFRVGFTLDDNDDNGADYVAFSSGNNGTTANRPQVVIQYYLP